MAIMTMAKKPQANDGSQPPTAEEDPFLSLSEVARRLGKHPETIRRWCIDGLLKAVRTPSGLLTVRRSVVNQFLGGSALEKRV